MSLTLPIPEFISTRRSGKQRPATTARRSPELKTLVVPVIWEENPTSATSVPLLINPAAPVSARRVKTVTRLKIPLELRLDPTL
jgi:hypothetical protein